MNAWRRLLGVLLLIAVPLAVHAALFPRLVGHWIGAYRGQPIDIQFHADGTGSYQGQAMKWDVRYGQLHLDRDGVVETFAMKADDETLVMAGGEMATLLVLVRVTDGEPAQGQKPVDD
ncbi:MAG: hypothetical protein K0Q76_364 [Panacagrimonas sp.]|nr:hypothetical protein [Panacagrimonas sp.]MCC2655256.1 hypothetical protein [Panacagrimonas sp.]